MAVWLVPAVIIFLVFAAIFFIGWAAWRTAPSRTAIIFRADRPVETTQRVETVAVPGRGA